MSVSDPIERLLPYVLLVALLALFAVQGVLRLWEPPPSVEPAE